MFRAFCIFYDLVGSYCKAFIYKAYAMETKNLVSGKKKNDEARFVLSSLELRNPEAKNLE